jgi:hypothetical protein
MHQLLKDWLEILFPVTQMNNAGALVGDREITNFSTNANISSGGQTGLVQVDASYVDGSPPSTTTIIFKRRMQQEQC